MSFREYLFEKIKTWGIIFIGCVLVACVMANNRAEKRYSNVSFNGGHCIECHSDLHLDYKCGNTYIFECDNCGMTYQTHI